MPKRVGDWVKLSGQLRDGFLVMAAIFYFFGYIVWAINAHWNGLGLLPAIDFQYFVAGAPPVLIIIVAYYIVLGVRRLQEKARDLIGPTPEGWKLYLSWTMVGLGGVATVLILVNTAKWFQSAFPRLSHSSWFVLSLALIVVVSTSFFPPNQNASSTAQQEDTNNKTVSKRAVSALREALIAFRLLLIAFVGILGIVYKFLIFTMLVLVALAYFAQLYPKIPQEFGGPRPQSACLDIVKAQISNETKEGLLPIDANKSNETVVRSLRVEVLFSGSDVMLVRSQGRVYKIARSTIQTVTTCN